MTGYESLTSQDFELTNWLNVLDYVQIRQCHHYAVEFEAAAKAATQRGDPNSALALNFLREVTDIHFNTDQPENPFTAFFSGNSYRSIVPSDFTDHEFELLRLLASQCPEAELRARFRDMLWVAANDYAAGKLAIYDYIESAKRMDGATDNEFFPNVKRAVQLAAKLGKRDLLPRCKTAVSGLLTIAKANGRHSRSLALLELLYNQKLGDSSTLAEEFATVAAALRQQKNYHVAHIALGLAAKGFTRANLSDQSTQIFEREIALYEQEADEEATAGHCFEASDLITRAISILTACRKSHFSLLGCLDPHGSYRGAPLLLWYHPFGVFLLEEVLQPSPAVL